MFDSTSISKAIKLPLSTVQTAVRRAQNAERIGSEPLGNAEALVVAAHADGYRGVDAMADAIREQAQAEGLAQAKAAPVKAAPTTPGAITKWQSPAGELLRQLWTETGDPLFAAVDVCRALGLGNPTKACGRLPPETTTLISIQGHRSDGKNTGNRPTRVVTEAGLYELISGSRKPEALAFKRWVYSEVLPSIRKTGSYALPGNTLPGTEPKPDGFAHLCEVLNQNTTAVLGLAPVLAAVTELTQTVAQLAGGIRVLFEANQQLAVGYHEVCRRLENMAEANISLGGRVDRIYNKELPAIVASPPPGTAPRERTQADVSNYVSHLAQTHGIEHGKLWRDLYARLAGPGATVVISTAFAKAHGFTSGLQYLAHQPGGLSAAYEHLRQMDLELAAALSA
jgi:hypothetical protein